MECSMKMSLKTQVCRLPYARSWVLSLCIDPNRGLYLLSYDINYSLRHWWRWTRLARVHDTWRKARRNVMGEMGGLQSRPSSWAHSQIYGLVGRVASWRLWTQQRPIQRAHWQTQRIGEFDSARTTLSSFFFSLKTKNQSLVSVSKMTIP